MPNNSERMSPSPERKQSPQEVLEDANMERHREILHEQTERAGEQSHENLDEVRREAVEKAQNAERYEKKAQLERLSPSPAERRSNRPIGKLEREASFATTMDEVRVHMSAPSRAFSKVIHNKTVERVSDTVGATVARPNAILSGAVLAFILTLAVYLIAKNMGYVLSGFETMGAFVVGWALGITYDFLKVMVTGRR